MGSLDRTSVINQHIDSVEAMRKSIIDEANKKREEAIKQANDEYDKTIHELESKINAFYNTVNPVKEHKKNLTQTIEKSIVLLKKENIKLDKNLGDLERNQVSEAISSNIDKVKNKESKELLSKYATIIDEEINTINTLTPNVINAEQELASNHHQQEIDFDDEAELDLSQYVTPKEEPFQIVNSTEDLCDDVKINNDLSLCDIASKAYDDPNAWINIYNYNKMIIDELCKKNNITLEGFIKNEGLLNGIVLKIPEYVNIKTTTESRKIA